MRADGSVLNFFLVRFTVKAKFVGLIRNSFGNIRKCDEDGFRANWFEEKM